MWWSSTSRRTESSSSKSWNCTNASSTSSGTSAGRLPASAATSAAALAGSLPADVPLLLDEAFVHFQDVEEEDAVLRLVEPSTLLLVSAPFSKIYGLSGLRTGYAVGSSLVAELLEALAPVLGVKRSARPLWSRRCA